MGDCEVRAEGTHACEISSDINRHRKCSGDEKWMP